ncbi:hypothetical protein [Streptomyces sp. NPDC091217]|uniref:hypothetical protein n=1 Tax=Streptomyces sp. NPDC091217 TaxID=3365975 RepID=UPI003813D930
MPFPDFTADRTRAVVGCRGCSCGAPGKRPGPDHAGQLERLRADAAAGGPDVSEPPITPEVQFIRPPRGVRARARR